VLERGVWLKVCPNQGQAVFSLKKGAIEKVVRLRFPAKEMGSIAKKREITNNEGSDSKHRDGYRYDIVPGALLNRGIITALDKVKH